jgi:hypothetical protein
MLAEMIEHEAVILVSCGRSSFGLSPLVYYVVLASHCTRNRKQREQSRAISIYSPPHSTWKADLFRTSWTNRPCYD